MAAVVLCATPARADQAIHLLDDTKIVGELLHFYDGLVTVELPNKTRMRLPTSKIRRIEFKLPKPRASLSTPAKSFDRLRKAALKGDLETYVDTHSSYYQMLLNHQVQLATPKKFTQQLKKEWGDVRLEVMGTETKGGMAVMKVRRRKGDDTQEGELRFVKENHEWKMILPL